MSGRALSAVVLALASGAVATGLAYACWYAALPRLSAARAGVLQLAVPVMTEVVAVIALGEEPSARIVGGGAAIIAGIALTLRR